MRSGSPPKSTRYQSGFGYLLVLFTVAAMGLLLAGTGQVWHTQVQREKEAELLFVGNQYRQAILAYYEHTPAAVKQYPARLEDLLLDNRFPMPRRHLRKLYRDPMTGRDEWGMAKASGRITGVYSQSEGVPLRQVFAARDSEFAGAQHYDQWLFLAGTGGTTPPASPASAAR